MYIGISLESTFYHIMNTNGEEARHIRERYMKKRHNA